MRSVAIALCGLTALGALTACRGQTSADAPIVPLRNMHRQQRYNEQAESWFFDDGRTMRPILEGTVSREGYLADDRIAQGVEDDHGTYVARVPDEVVRAADGMQNLAERGRLRYGIFCTPCHGGLGDGNGIVYVRGQGGNYQFPQPANLNDPRIRHMPDGQLYATIANGVRNMAGYASQIPVSDRWAIVAYVRALELAQAGANTAQNTHTQAPAAQHAAADLSNGVAQ